MVLNIVNRLKKQPSLKQHSFFVAVEHYINIELANLPIENELKKRVVVAFMTTQLRTFSDTAMELVDNVNVLSIDECEKTLIKCLSEAEDDALKKGIPSIFIEKYRKWNSENIKIMIDSVNQICSSKFYLTNYDKMLAILDVLKYSFRVMIIDAEQTINELNGDLERALKGTKYDF